MLIGGCGREVGLECKAEFTGFVGEEKPCVVSGDEVVEVKMATYEKALFNAIYLLIFLVVVGAVLQQVGIIK